MKESFSEPSIFTNFLNGAKGYILTLGKISEPEEF